MALRASERDARPMPRLSRLTTADTSPPLRVLIAHRDPLARVGLRALLDHEFEVVDEVASAGAAVRLGGERRPDVVVLDSACLGAVSALHACQAGVVVLLPSDAPAELVACVRAGARGVVEHDADRSVLVRVTRTVAAGGVDLGPAMAARLIEFVIARPERLDPQPSLLSELTRREREAVELVAWGLSNQEIAEHLVISPATARTHVSRAMVKLHARHRAQLVVLAFQCGLVGVGDEAGRTAAAHRVAGRRTLPLAA